MLKTSITSLCLAALAALSGLPAVHAEECYIVGYTNAGTAGGTVSWKGHPPGNSGVALYRKGKLHWSWVQNDWNDHGLCNTDYLQFKPPIQYNLAWFGWAASCDSDGFFTECHGSYLSSSGGHIVGEVKNHVDNGYKIEGLSGAQSQCRMDFYC